MENTPRSRVALTRREFLKRGALGALAVPLLANCGHDEGGEQKVQSPTATDAEPKVQLSAVYTDGYGPQPVAGHSNGIPTRVLGKTGRVVTILGLGGAHVIHGKTKTDEQAIALVDRAYDLGVTYFDTAHNYGSGRSERVYGEALSTKDRDSYYLNTKIYNRDYDTASRDIDEAMKLLKVDTVDCMMVHGVDYKSTTEEIFGPKGSMRALIKARDDGRTRLLGVSGHANPQSLNMAMDEFDFDVALLAINPADYMRLPFEQSCYRKAVEQKLGIINMKPLGGLGEMIKSEKGGAFTLEELLNYSWSLKGHATIVGLSSIQELEQAVAAAKEYKPITHEEKLAMIERSRPLTHGNCVNFRVPMDWETA